jgi:hypothetical protein
MTDDLYRVLQVEPHADAEAIQAAYRRLARLYHPDLNTQPGAAERMRAINAAYRVLSDPARRAAYDARRYLPRARSTTVAYRPVPPTPRPVTYTPPTNLQRRVDRVVAVVGVVLLLLIGFYVVSVWPYMERAFQEERGMLPRPVPILSAPSNATRSTDHAMAPVSQRVRNDNGLRAFPGTVLVAPESLPPFSSLPITRIDANGLGLARYAVYYGDWSVGGATISGLVGRSAFDNAVPRLAGCAAEAAYCSGPAPGQTSGNDGFELFRPGDLIEDYPAVATHRVCCNGTFWSVAWYEPRANMSYAVDLSRALALQFASNTVDPDNLAAARGVAGLARQLVRLP